MPAGRETCDSKTSTSAISRGGEMGRRLWYCDHHEIPLPHGHKFPMRKYRLLRDLLTADGIYTLEPAPFAERAAIERVHDPDYVRGFLEGTLDPRVMRRIGFPWSEGLV